MTFKVPPQGINLMNPEEKQKTVKVAKSAVFIEMFLAIALKNVMNMLLSSIIIFQILAHLPLADIFLPANA